MSFIANLKSIEENFDGKNIVVGNGHCAIFVQSVVGVGGTSNWRQGIKVAGNVITPGTVIATFGGGKYRNYYGLSKEQQILYGSHAGIYVGENEKGIEMWQQYVSKGVHKQQYYFKHGAYSRFITDADNYFVVEQVGNPLAIEDSCWVDSEGFSWNRDQW